MIHILFISALAHITLSFIWSFKLFCLSNLHPRYIISPTSLISSSSYHQCSMFVSFLLLCSPKTNIFFPLRLAPYLCSTSTFSLFLAAGLTPFHFSSSTLCHLLTRSLLFFVSHSLFQSFPFSAPFQPYRAGKATHWVVSPALSLSPSKIFLCFSRVPWFRKLFPRRGMP